VVHLQANGFTVVTREVSEAALMEMKIAARVPRRLEACHTALVGGYVVEGHVPAADIKQLLAQRPAVVGLAVPGMPVGSPGMEQGGRHDPYEVLTFDREGRTTVFASH
jgi:hypothetical protein